MKSVIFLAFFIAARASPSRQFDPRSIQEVALWWFTSHSAAAGNYSGQPRAIEQSDNSAPNPLWVGACSNYDGWEIDTYSHLRGRLDFGVAQLADQDLTAGTPQDHTAALSSATVELAPGQTLEMVVGVGGADFVACPAPTCPWDIDASGTVGILDLLALIAQWGKNPGGPPDFDGDGIVGLFDMLTLLANWGPCP